MIDLDQNGDTVLQRALLKESWDALIILMQLEEGWIRQDSANGQTFEAFTVSSGLETQLKMIINAIVSGGNVEAVIKEIKAQRRASRKTLLITDERCL